MRSASIVSTSPNGRSGSIVSGMIHDDAMDSMIPDEAARKLLYLEVYLSDPAGMSLKTCLT